MAKRKTTTWRSKVDWVAAGRKAFATRQRNERAAKRAKRAKAVAQ